MLRYKYLSNGHVDITFSRNMFINGFEDQNNSCIFLCFRSFYQCKLSFTFIEVLLLFLFQLIQCF